MPIERWAVVVNGRDPYLLSGGGKSRNRLFASVRAAIAPRAKKMRLYSKTIGVRGHGRLILTDKRRGGMKRRHTDAHARVQCPSSDSAPPATACVQAQLKSQVVAAQRPRHAALTCGCIARAREGRRPVVQVAMAPFAKKSRFLPARVAAAPMAQAARCRRQPSRSSALHRQITCRLRCGSAASVCELAGQRSTRA